jgi:decaprenyl-phosphate phosphoribosyltransferase
MSTAGGLQAEAVDKNLLVFAGPLFSFRFQLEACFASLVALLAFCLMSSAIYLLNDCLDVSADRVHDTKCRRPIAAGQVSIPAALGVATILALLSLGIAWKLHASLTWLILLYGVIQVVYCLWLKQQPLLDLFCIASGFLLRAIAGVVA